METAAGITVPRGKKMGVVTWIVSCSMQGAQEEHMTQDWWEERELVKAAARKVEHSNEKAE